MKVKRVHESHSHLAHTVDGGLWRNLMAAVIVQAVRDTKDEQPEKALDAVFFLLDDAPIYFEALGIPDINIEKFLSNGKGLNLPLLKINNKGNSVK